MQKKTDLVVVGGGLAGLVAAACAARSGLSVRLLEKASAAGGRARTQDRDSFHFNLGPHALYRGLEGMEVLRRLGIEPRGGLPGVDGAWALNEGQGHLFPAGPGSLLRTRLLGWRGKLELGRLLAGVARIDTSRFDGVPVAAMVDQLATQPEVRGLLKALFRLSTYAHAPGQQCGGQALAQLQSALASNVLYLDGGWQTLVDGLRACAESAGAVIEAGAAVEEVEVADGCVCGVRLRDSTTIAADAVVLAIAPSEAAALVGASASSDAGSDARSDAGSGASSDAGSDAGSENGSDQGSELRAWADAVIPVRAACLDLALDELPVPERTFALGIDEPVYFSVHSAAAELAPSGKALVQAAVYLAPGEVGGPTEEERLLALCDRVQPGWRAHEVNRRFLPNLLVYHDLVQAERGGLAGRPGPAVPSLPGLYVAGDWVGRTGILADASIASGAAAAELAAAGLARARTATA